MSKIHGMCETRTYKSWEAMKQRCTNTNDPAFKYYKGRGTTICDRWQSFVNFFADMGIRPPGLTLERKDNNGSYEPGNCYWATRKEQRANTRPASYGRNVQRWFIAMDGQGTMIAANNQNEFARQYGLDQGGISMCLRKLSKTYRGWTFKKIGEHV